jgi:hypothetical protein
MTLLLILGVTVAIALAAWFSRPWRSKRDDRLSVGWRGTKAFEDELARQRKARTEKG